MLPPRESILESERSARLQPVRSYVPVRLVLPLSTSPWVVVRLDVPYKTIRWDYFDLFISKKEA
jgi:hypothetical protein